MGARVRPNLGEVRDEVTRKLRLETVEANRLSPGQQAAVVALCGRAYDEDLEASFASFRHATHVLGLVDSALVSHAMWVPRWLQPAGGRLLRTAYVEMVATEPRFQKRGYATAVMERLAKAIPATFDLGGLSPADTGLYARLGWVFWRGPLFIRARDGLLPTPDERMMILRLRQTPALDLDVPLSAEWREGELW